ncbi:hypothetical protein Tco_0356418 [Tanacetum coccineum]
MIKSLRLPKSGNQLRFLIHRVPSGRISNALSIPRKFSALMFSSLIASVWASRICDGLDGMHHSKQQNRCFLLVMIRLELHTTFALVVRKLTLGLLPRCGRRCPILNCFNLSGVNMNSLTINYVPKKLYDIDPEITFGELGIQFFLFEFYPYLCSGKQSWEIFLLSLTLVDDSLILSQSSSRHSNLEVGRINHRSWELPRGARATGAALGIKLIWNSTWRTGGRPGRFLGKTSGNSLTTENFGMILGQPVHTDDNIKTTEFNRHEINFERCKILLGMKEISGFKTIDDSGNWGWSKQLACEQ